VIEFTKLVNATYLDEQAITKTYKKVFFNVF